MLPFWPIHLPASAIHTMKARGNDNNDEDSDDSNDCNDKVWDEDGMMNNEGRDDVNEDEDDEDNGEEEDEDDGQQT